MNDTSPKDHSAGRRRRGWTPRAIFVKIMAVDREQRMVDLKRQVNDLARQAGGSAPYDLSFADGPDSAGDHSNARPSERVAPRSSRQQGTIAT